MDDEIFVEACVNNNLEKVKEMVENGYDFEYNLELDNKVRSPLAYAVKHGSIDVARYLIEKGADINDDEVYPSPLKIAVRNKNVEMTSLLLDNGAIVDICDAKHSTPLQWAVFGGCEEIVKLLLDNGADANHVDDNGITPLFLAKLRHFDHIETLLTKSLNG